MKIDSKFSELLANQTNGGSNPGRLSSGTLQQDFRQILQEAAQTKTAAPRPTAPASAASSTTTSAATPDAGFTVTVRENDTLANIARRALEARGLDSSPQASLRAALQLAKDNKLPNADLIFPGQKINLSSLPTGKAENGLEYNTPEEAKNKATTNASLPQSPSTQSMLAKQKAQAVIAQPGTTKNTAGRDGQTANPILEKTLDRAVSLGYVNRAQKHAVRDKILSLANEHRFSPDDLAVVTLIESDGMNPKATNGRCHGLIQFCDGPNRGAATVGFKHNAKAITELGVLDQLNLVGKYFEETGLRQFGKSKPASLDDLYLTVLTPAARRERGSDVELDIAGQQAATLYPGNDTSSTITRASLLEGLRQNARGKLAAPITQPAQPAQANTPAQPALPQPNRNAPMRVSALSFSQQSKFR